ncbi:hypothetical protein CC2G_010246 [Coprinopsis cinerea AmutBmut pab1-1]|nr:hypothetical protein CC2G_010246 [Coprinopsis cinerea AmutBmut pab1-1]
MFKTFFALLLTLFTLLNAVSAAPHTHTHRHIAKARRAVDLQRSDIQEILEAHNSVRVQHNARPLGWSPFLASKAAFWADMCILQYSDGILLDRPYGESIVAATGTFTIKDAIDTLVSSRNTYDPRTAYSQFTQIVWKSTTQVGCAISRCEGILDRPVTLYVCVYDPPGNVVGELAENVEV